MIVHLHTLQLGKYDNPHDINPHEYTSNSVRWTTALAVPNRDLGLMQVGEFQTASNT